MFQLVPESAGLLCFFATEVKGEERGKGGGEGGMIHVSVHTLLR